MATFKSELLNKATPDHERCELLIQRDGGEGIVCLPPADHTPPDLIRCTGRAHTGYIHDKRRYAICRNHALRIVAFQAAHKARNLVN
jgi:hypothetical protein